MAYSAAAAHAAAAHAHAAACGVQACEVVVQCGAVELLLAQCQIDEHSPLAREWALWATSSLLTKSPEAKKVHAGGFGFLVFSFHFPLRAQSQSPD